MLIVIEKMLFSNPELKDFVRNMDGSKVKSSWSCVGALLSCLNVEKLFPRHLGLDGNPAVSQLKRNSGFPIFGIKHLFRGLETKASARPCV